MINEPRSFYPSRKDLALFSGKWLLFSILLALLIWMIFVPQFAIGFIFLILGTSIFSSMGVIILVPLAKITLTSEWLRGYNFFGYYRFLNWQTVTKAKRANFLGLHYYTIFDKGHTFPIWLPLFHYNQAELERLIC